MTLSLPTARLAPFTVREAVAVAPVELAPEGASVAVPKAVLPCANITLPVGGAVPLAGFTVTVSTVDALWERVGALAVIAAVVDITGAMTVTVTVIEVDCEAVKLPPPP
jgi:hypothetical protein